MQYIKKLAAFGLISSGLLAFAAIRQAAAAPTDSINITVSVRVVSVSVSTTTWAIGTISPNTSNISGAIPVQNDGNTQEDYSLDLDYSGGWTIGASTTPASNTFVLLALFTTTPAASVTDGMFGVQSSSDDVIPEASPSSAGPDQFARNNETAGAKGYDISASAFRDLLLNFRAPTSNTVSAEQSITVTVTAAAG